MVELNDKIYSKIQDLCAKADDIGENGDFKTAIDHYRKAFDLVPEPKENWEASTWILTAIGDANFHLKDFPAGVKNLSNAMLCPNAIGNPFIHLRLGQCQFEIGNLKLAADELTRAYAIEGDEIFSEDDHKYFEFLKSRIQTKPTKRASFLNKLKRLIS